MESINLTLIIPAKYESESLPIFLKEIGQINANICIILEENDFQTIDSIKNFTNIKLIFQKKKGYGAAILEGVNHCDTEFFCIINADGSMDPKYLEMMLTECEKKDFVFGSRYLEHGGSEDDTIITYLGNKFFTSLGNFLYNLNISDILYTYILGRSRSFKDLNLQSLDFRLCVELPIKAKLMQKKYICLPSFERSRISGKKKVNAFKDGFLILTSMLGFLFKKN